MKIQILKKKFFSKWEKKLADNIDTSKITQHIVQVIISDAVLVYDMSQHEISNNVVCATSKASDQHTHTQSDQSLC